MRRLPTLLLALVIASAAVEPAALRCVFGAEAPATHGCCPGDSVISPAPASECCALRAPRDSAVPPSATMAVAAPLALLPVPVAAVTTTIAARTLSIQISPPVTIDLPTLYSVLLI